MPFKSEAQRRYLWARRPDVAREFADATPRGKRLPEKVASAYMAGGADALLALGLKAAAEELRLKIPDRTFHGFDAARRAAASRADKKAEHLEDADDLAEAIGGTATTVPENPQLDSRDPLDRATAWGTPSSLAAGDTASRLGDMGQSTAVGTVF